MESAFNCNICFLIYNETRKPIMLLCGHSFCSICIEALHPHDNLCPSCRKVITLSFNELPINYSLLDLSIAFINTKMPNSETENEKDTILFETTCKSHEEQVIKFWCKISEEWLCDLCNQDHIHEESTGLKDCTISIESALVSFKEKIQKSNVTKLNEVQKIIGETEKFSSISDGLSEKLEVINTTNKM